MKNKFTRRQLNVMFLLATIIVLMMGGLLFINLFPEFIDAVTPPSPEKPHEKARAARTSLSPHFSREMNLGGSGDETLCDIFTYEDKLYIFGSTSSNDKDLDTGSGVFLAVCGADGSTKQFFGYGEKGDVLVKTALCESGFLLGVNRAAGGSAIIKITLAGAFVTQTNTSGVSGEQIADLKYYIDGTTVAVMNVRDGTAGNVSLKARVFDATLNPVAERLFAHACSVEYIDMFETSDGYVIAANLTSPLINRLAFISWGLTRQGQFYDIDLGTSDGYKCYGVMPYMYGYVAIVTDSKSVCDLITVTTALTLHSRIYLRASSVTSAKMFFAPDGYYCLLKHGRDLASMTVFDPTLQNRSSVGAFSSVGDVYSHSTYGVSTLFCGATKSGIKLVTDVNGKITADVTFGGAGMENVKAVRLDGKFVVVCEASQKTSDCPENYGGKDIWIAVMN